MSSALPAPVAVGQVIAGKFRVERVLGVGGMGVVVAAHHLLLGRTVALKFLIKGASRSDEAAARFLREGRALALITSQNVARVLDVGSLPSGDPYLVLEYLDGADLGDVLEKRGALPITEAVGYLLQVCEAVAEAHANGIVHRDLKPSNLYLVRGTDGLPLIKVLDFGISKSVELTEEAAGQYQTHTGALVGSPLYMSPEQIRNAKGVDERTDIWSLGIILHELLCGSPPFRGASVSGTLAAVAADPPRPARKDRPEVPQALEAIIFKCLDKVPQQRYATVAELADALLPFAPASAAAGVERIHRVLGAANLGKGVDAHAATVRDAQSGSGTVPSWEGPDGARRTIASRRLALVSVAFGGSAFVIAILAYFALRSSPEARLPDPPPTMRASAAPDASLSQPRPAQEPAAEPSSSAAMAAQPSASAAARPPVAPVRSAVGWVKSPPRSKTTAQSKLGDEDGTSDRK